MIKDEMNDQNTTNNYSLCIIKDLYLIQKLFSDDL